MYKYMAKTVLLVEDEPMLSRVLHDRLSFESFNLLLAENGEVGLGIALDKHPDLIITDYLMPKMDGLTMVKKLREDNWGKNIQVIILSNVSDMANVPGAINDKITEYMVKSELSLDDVVEKIKTKLAQ